MAKGLLRMRDGGERESKDLGWEEEDTEETREEGRAREDREGRQFSGSPGWVNWSCSVAASYYGASNYRLADHPQFSNSTCGDGLAWMTRCARERSITFSSSDKVFWPMCFCRLWPKSKTWATPHPQWQSNPQWYQEWQKPSKPGGIQRLGKQTETMEEPRTRNLQDWRNLCESLETLRATDGQGREWGFSRDRAERSPTRSQKWPGSLTVRRWEGKIELGTQTQFMSTTEFRSSEG